MPLQGWGGLAANTQCVCSMCMPHLEAIFGHLDIPTHMKQLDQTFSYETKESIKELQRAIFSSEKQKQNGTRTQSVFTQNVYLNVKINIFLAFRLINFLERTL